MSQLELPNEVRELIHAGRKIDAIKQLREARSLGLKDAKQAVDAYVAAHPESIRPRPTGQASPGARLLPLALLAAAVWVAWRFLAS